jgi:hypothetical protein
MASAKTPPPNPSASNPGSSVNWTLLGVLAIVAIVAIVGMVRPDSVKGSLGGKGPQIDIHKTTQP